MRLALTEAGEGPPLVLLHGLFGAGQNWGAIRRVLSARHRVLTPDLRNHGASPQAAAMALTGASWPAAFSTATP